MTEGNVELIRDEAWKCFIPFFMYSYLKRSMKTFRQPTFANGIAFIFCVFFVASVGAQQPAQRHALMIACSEFPYAPGIKPLPGAFNDIARFETLLQSQQYDFDSIKTLAGWNEDSNKNPTVENITTAFEELISRSSQGDQVFILMSGHGTQIKAKTNTLDEFGMKEEPDGMDEVFIAADYGPEAKVIRDDTIGRWLDRLRRKGAHVWIVFDCCHSGSLTRSHGDEEPRRIVSDDSRSLAVVAAKDDWRDTGIVDLQTCEPGSAAESQNGGSLVALFAAQNYETTPEMTRPIGARPTAENRRGLLSFHLEYLLKNLVGQTTYRDLENALANRYYAERAMRGPNPYFEGDLDRTVFGYESMQRSNTMRLQKVGEDWRLLGGVMDGVTEGTELTVSSHGENRRETIGSFRATEVGLYRSVLEWIETPQGELTPADVSSLSCDISKQPVNPWNVAVEWLDTAGAYKRTNSIEQPLRDWLAEQQRNPRAPITTRANSSANVWSVCVATPEAARRFGVDVIDTSVLLLNEDAVLRAENPDQSETGNELSVVYAIADLEKIKQNLSTDFERLFRMQRLFQLAGLFGDGGPLLKTRGVNIEFLRDTANSSERLHSAARLEQAIDSDDLRVGDEVVVSLSSTKPQKLWYTILLVQSNGLILPVHAGSILDGRSFSPSLLEINKIRLKPTKGTSAFVAVTVPVLDQRRPADFSYLGQLPIGVHSETETAATRSAEQDHNSAPSTAIGGLLSNTTRGASDSQADAVAVKQDGAQIAVRSWSIRARTEQ
ncbi:caspase family protein [Roseimaritima ulvae]|uniref:Caspase domain protein n=1 Tax=Roseimaritima ulvae TaxID=980254 RepID=A0A5B9R502_9BACT|nr:caspase family protein [Roseimaritima ulvae]QEG41283.1 Caspase domain protein [Roseimaritima ulvae]